MNAVINAGSLLTSYEEAGYVVLADLLTPDEKRDVIRGTVDVERWPETPGRWLQYFECHRVTRARQLCRTENFIPYHAGLRELLCGPKVLAVVAALLGEPAILYKDKINFKLSGANGFAPHQDAPAFTGQGQSRHLTMMIAADAATLDNGCLEMVRGGHRRGALLHPGGCLPEGLVQEMHWSPVLLDPGDAVFFGSYIPHRSGPNRTDRPRRSLYITYNGASEGDRHDVYYRDKRTYFPPECERAAGVDYSEGAKVYNLANPIR